MKGDFMIAREKVRVEQGIAGFVPCGGQTQPGIAFLKSVHAEVAAMKASGQAKTESQAAPA